MSPKRWCSFWNGPCLGDMLVLRGVLIGSKMNWKGACLVMLRCPGVLNPGYKRWDERCQACVFYSCFFFGCVSGIQRFNKQEKAWFFSSTTIQEENCWQETTVQSGGWKPLGGTTTTSAHYLHLAGWTLNKGNGILPFVKYRGKIQMTTHIMNVNSILKQPLPTIYRIG